MVCGSPGIDVAFLRRHTRYDGINPGHPVIGMFWEVLASLTPAQQASVMRFMWARERLPPSDAAFTRPFIIARMPRDDPDTSLPQAHTCVFQVCACDTRQCHVTLLIHNSPKPLSLLLLPFLLTPAS